MSLNNPHGQSVPSEVPTRTSFALRLLDDNRKGIARWFFKGLLAFNLILGSVALWLLVLLRFG